jgi:TolB-like protein/Tfp pilus assembly protein PilF
MTQDDIGPVEQASLPPGTTVGPFRITRLLGAGGMGEVFLAHDSRLDRDVALKFLRPQPGTDAAARARFGQETRAIARLDHPNIVTLHEVGEHRGRPYLVMQFVEGHSLTEFSRDRTLSIETVLDLGLQLCAGLQAAHERGVIHRDLKPSNILVDDRLRARIVDFGLARIRGAGRLTGTGSICGTTGYIPPESIAGEEVDARGDLFSLGVVLYELLAGRLPFTAASEVAYLHAALYERPEPVSRFREDAPAELEAIIEKALARDRATRHQTADELAADLRGIRRRAGGPAPGARPRPSVAVLAFEDMSPEHDQEYLCDGITEELIHALTRIEGLRVIARDSAFVFKGSHADVREIGRALGVGALLAGSVRKSSSRVRIGAQLIDARDGSHLWAETYDRTLDDVFAIQDEVCLAIAERLRGTLLDEEKARLVKRGTRDPRAYTLFLKGRFFFNQRAERALRRSLECYAQAVAADPRFALAYAGLAEAYEALGTLRALAPEVAYPEARRAGLRAVELDDSLAEAHVGLATVRMYCDWDWAGARRELERALVVNPACPEAHHMSAHWHELMGEFEQAASGMDRALEIEPVAPGLRSCLVQILFNARRYDEAIREAAMTLEMAPNFVGVLGWIGVAHLQQGHVEAAFKALRQGLDQRPGDPRLDALLGYACAVAGDAAQARAALERLTALSRERYVDPYFLAWPHAGRRDADAAFLALGTACDERSQWACLMGVDPLLDGLRPDARFPALLERVGLHI